MSLFSQQYSASAVYKLQFFAVLHFGQSITQQVLQFKVICWKSFVYS